VQVLQKRLGDHPIIGVQGKGGINVAEQRDLQILILAVGTQNPRGVASLLAPSDGVRNREQRSPTIGGAAVETFRHFRIGVELRVSLLRPIEYVSVDHIEFFHQYEVLEIEALDLGGPWCAMDVDNDRA
jgi:hypothetical protein